MPGQGTSTVGTLELPLPGLKNPSASAIARSGVGMGQATIPGSMHVGRKGEEEAGWVSAATVATYESQVWEKAW